MVAMKLISMNKPTTVLMLEGATTLDCGTNRFTDGMPPPAMHDTLVRYETLLGYHLLEGSRLP